MRDQPQSITRPLADTRTFILTLWEEEPSPGQKEWRGKIEAIPSGAMRYFREWARLIKSLEELLVASGGG